MRLYPEEHETIVGTARRLRAGEITCQDVLRACLDRIDQMEPAVRAWVLVDREGALEQARSLDEELVAGKGRGPLHGIPIGVKDIIHVKGFPTGNGLAGQRWFQPPVPAEADAIIVARLREAGAIILGKTVSTPFAWIDPPVTRNPWNFDRTPGGSSSGSAAAVACGMCLGALGTQTGGSITRPVAFCGVAGMKPTYGQMSTVGITPLAPSLDHPGPIARSVADLRLMYLVMLGGSEQPSIGARGSTPLPRGREAAALVRLGGFFDEEADAEMWSALCSVVWTLEGSQATMLNFRDELPVLQALRDHRTILAYEAVETHGSPAVIQSRYMNSKMRSWFFPPRLRELLEEGASIPEAAYIRAQESRRLAEMLRVVLSYGAAFVTPAAPGPAPDPSTTGSPAFNSPWSLLGLPTVSFPIGLSADGLPLAVQLVGGAGLDLELLQTAEWCESAIRAAKDRGP
jgi:Asp-tRNA(Asn)/Glu-tRNA(Gln) amidotransferase A subunit family amidase